MMTRRRGPRPAALSPGRAAPQPGSSYAARPGDNASISARNADVAETWAFPRFGRFSVSWATARAGRADWPTAAQLLLARWIRPAMLPLDFLDDLGDAALRN